MINLTKTKEKKMKQYKVTFKKVIIVEEVVVDADNKQNAFFAAAEKIQKDFDGYPTIKEVKGGN